VTARKQAEEALRASEHRLNLVLSAGRLATWDLHLPTNEVVWSDEHFRMLGYEIGEVAPSYRAWASRLQPEDREGTETLFAQAMKDGREYHAEYRSLWPDGTVRWLEGRGSCYRDAQGNVTRCCGVTMDITERKRAEAALKDADRRKDEFLATLAHELRNPLAPIRSGLHVLRRAGAQGEKAERVQAMMERQVDHLIRLVDDLLEVSRISRGKIVLLKEPMDLATVIKHSVEMSRGLIDAGALELRLMLPEEPLPIEADAVRLTQVFSNLLNNAAKFTNSGGRIEIAAERAGGQAVVSVADTGVGIAKDMLPRVFDLFAQASNGRDRSSGGLGIGLSLVRSLVELHGGAVEAHSEGAGRGSRFVVRLPLSSKIEAGAPPSKLLKCEATASRRVLVIDDTPDVADSFALLLETLGANVRVAHSGVEGLATCAEFAPELVFLDIGMPGMDGFETARRMRELPAGQKATLIALTGWGEEGTRARVKEAGFDGHLTKPADVEEVEMLLGSTSRVS
ncbi:MAG TPA: ATP-binding protein, partial [Methylocystis sp.]|nr:ATP-binding protein [Methylocystis sp.]